MRTVPIQNVDPLIVAELRQAMVEGGMHVQLWDVMVGGGQNVTLTRSCGAWWHVVIWPKYGSIAIDHLLVLVI
jgi:hypothetical protein